MDTTYIRKRPYIELLHTNLVFLSTLKKQISATIIQHMFVMLTTSQAEKKKKHIRQA